MERRKPHGPSHAASKPWSGRLYSETVTARDSSKTEGMGVTVHLAIEGGSLGSLGLGGHEG